MPNYITLTIQLTDIGSDTYRVRLIREDSQSGAINNPLGHTTPEVTIPVAAPTDLAFDADAYGRWLSEALLAESNLEKAIAAILDAAESQNRPLRLILDLPTRLQALRWEGLHLPGVGAIALRERVRLTRVLPSAANRPVPHTIPDPLRILSMVAAPTDLAEYNLPQPNKDAFLTLAQEALPQAAHQQTAGTLEEIRAGLKAGADILVLVCHGKLSDGIPYLLLEDEQEGKVTLVRARELADVIKDLDEQPRLVMLVSCFGAGVTGEDPAGAAGPLLVDAGVPAVVAMRSEFTVASALAMLPVFLGELAKDGAVDRSLAAARWKIRARHDAWLPVLYSRLHDGLLWEGELPLPADTPSPYRDLRAFQARDAEYFFGREAVTATLLERIGAQQLLAVIGPSGSGKSSVVLAGLVPAVRQKHSEQWLDVTMRPGNDPFGALAAAFLSQLAPAIPFEERLKRQQALSRQLHDKGIALPALVAELLRDRAATQLLLIIDQFEELMAQGQLAERFVETVITPLNRQLPLKVVLTMRADFMAAALAIPGLAAALDERIYPLGPMSRAEMSEAITRPVEIVGARFERGLVSYILDDVGEHAGNLPLLQFTLSRLWERRAGRLLTFAQYEALGKVDGALKGHADSVLAGFEGEDEKAAVRRLVVQLIRPGLGASDTRRVAAKDQFSADEQALIDELAGQRLLVTDLNDQGEETVEIAHEALIESWGTLRQWMNADREFRTWQERLRLSMEQWQNAERDKGTLLRGLSLAQAHNWLEERFEDMSLSEREFIQGSLDQEKRELNQKRIGKLTARVALALALSVILLGTRSVWSSRCAAIGLAWNIGVHCQRIDILGINLFRANLTGEYLGWADLTGADLSGADLTRANLSRIHLTGADLGGADLIVAELYGSDLGEADLGGANLIAANLGWADLSGADLFAADLTGADLTGADLTGADLTGADLTRADLTGADLTGADLDRANLSEATTWTAEQLSQAYYTIDTIMPDGSRYYDWIRDPQHVNEGWPEPIVIMDPRR